MTDGIRIVTNLPDFKAALHALGDDFERNTIRAASRAASAIFLQRAQSFAPVLQSSQRNRVIGLLKNSLYMARARDSTRGQEHWFVSVKHGSRAAKGGNDAFYWRFVEAGHLARGPGSGLKGGSKSRALQRARAKASGASFVEGSHYLARAFTAGQNQALEKFYDVIGARIDKENAKR